MKLLLDTCSFRWALHEYPLTPEIAASAGGLVQRRAHRDPFDRLLIWTALNEDFAVVSGDSALPDYASERLKIIR